MTGFTFKGGTVNTQKTFSGEIRISGNSHSFRIDHCTFDQLHGANLATSGFLWGVIDHCQFNTAGVHPIIVKHETWNGQSHGNGSWADDPSWGSERFVFIEDNVFENAAGAKRIDSFEGARFVVRYNQFHNGGVVMHGTEPSGRGAKQVEEYNNTYVNDSPSAAGQIRSGCIITHDNTWTNGAKGHVLQAFRLYKKSPRWGPADGQNLWDKNVPNGATGYWATGTHTGADGATVLTDSNASKTWWDDSGIPQTGAWPINRWYVEGVAYMVRNRTRESSQGDIRTWAISNTANTVTCSFKTFTGDHVTFNTGDTYEIWKVSQALDQPGMGKSDLLVGLGTFPTGTTPYADPHQVAEPCYSWNNTQDGAAFNLESSEPSIKEGRDFFNGTPKPGYKPFIYPHPLVSGTPPPPPRAIPDRDSAGH